jgi:hypothetical protein
MEIAKRVNKVFKDSKYESSGEDKRWKRITKRGVEAVLRGVHDDEYFKNYMESLVEARCNITEPELLSEQELEEARKWVRTVRVT